MIPFIYEKKLTRRGFKLVAGVDEVGRGPLAGPIVAAAVILPLDCSLPDLDDSKKLAPQKREKVFYQIKRCAIGIGVAFVNHKRIDQINIGRANLLAMKIAVEKLKVAPDFLLVDGERNKIDLSIPQRGISGGDRRCASIAAASIIAKVMRDRWMVKYHEKFPHYGFLRHKGYGTREHMQKLAKYGPCPIHRRSFFPVSSLPAGRQAFFNWLDIPGYGLLHFKNKRR